MEGLEPIILRITSAVLYLLSFTGETRPRRVGADSRNRTDIISLEGCCTALVLYPLEGSLR